MTDRLTFHKDKSPTNPNASIWHLILNGKRVKKTYVIGVTYYEGAITEYTEEEIDNNIILYYNLMQDGKYIDVYCNSLYVAKAELVKLINQ